MLDISVNVTMTSCVVEVYEVSRRNERRTVKKIFSLMTISPVKCVKDAVCVLKGAVEERCWRMLASAGA